MTEIATHGNHVDADYDAFLARINTRFAANVQQGAAKVFMTDAEGLWESYLDAFVDPAERQYHTCHACRHFIQRFGGLVVVDEQGRTTPAIWNEDDAPDHYKAAITTMRKLVSRANVTDVFMSSDAKWGTPVTGDWHHLAVVPPKVMVYTGRTLTAGQAMAEKREDFKTVMHALNEFTQPMVEQALTLLKSDALYRSEKVLGQAQWLYDLHVAKAAGHDKKNVVWRAIASAPAGFCHPRSSMIGALLEDIAAGMEFSEVSRRFASKMHPLAYQRPQAAPKAGAIAQAEKLFEQLELAPALARRIARLDEVPKVWEPRAAERKEPTGGVFGHLAPKGAQPLPNMEIPAQLMTLQKFVQTVMPEAEQVEVHLGAGNLPFFVVTTAVNADAPRLFHWDHPFSWYVWHGGAPAGQYGMAAGWTKLAAITRLPARWDDDGERFKHHGDGVILLLDGARETRRAGAALFPEHMRGEIHGVRSVIEAHSRSAQMEGLDVGSAIGIDMRQGGGGYPVLLRVTAAGRSQTYKIDRWD